MSSPIAVAPAGMFDSLFERTPVAMALLNRDGECVRVNGSLCHLLDREPQQLLGCREHEFTHPEDRAADLDAIARILGGEMDHWQCEKRFVRPDRSIVWVSASVIFLRDLADGPIGWVAQFHDISAGKQTESELRRQSELLSGVIDNAPIGEAIIAPDGAFVRVNRALCEIVGYDEAELLSLSFDAITEPGSADAELALIRQLLRGESRTYQIESYTRKDGARAWVRVTVSLARDDAHEPLHFIAQIEDVTESRRSQEALRHSEARLTAIIESAPAMIALRDLSGRYEHVNSYVSQVTGSAQEELVGVLPANRQPAEIVEELAALDAEMLESGGPRSREIAIPHIDGTRHMFDITVYPVRDADGTISGLGSFALDVTARIEAERRLRERERQLAEAQALAQLGSWELNLETERLQWSDELCRICAPARVDADVCGVHGTRASGGPLGSECAGRPRATVGLQ